MIKSIVNGIKWTSISSVSLSVAQIISLAVISRFISPSEFGIFVTYSVLLNIIIIPSRFGFGSALIQKKHIYKADVRLTLIFIILNSCILLSIFMLFFLPITNYFEIPNTRDIAFGFVLGTVFTNYYFVKLCEMQRSFSFKWISIINVTGYVFVYAPFAIILSYYDLGYTSLIVAQVLQVVFASIISSIYVYKNIHYETGLTDIRHFLNFGSGFTLAKAGNFIATEGDALIISKLFGVEAAGLYKRAIQILRIIPSIYSSVIDTVIFPTLSQIQSDNLRLGEIYKNFRILIFMLTSIATCVCYLYSELIILVILGEQWLDVVFIVEVGSIFITFRVLVKLSDCVSRAKGAVYKRAVLQWFFATQIILFSIIGSTLSFNATFTLLSVAILLNEVAMFILCKILLKDRSDSLNNIIDYFRYIAVIFFVGFANEYLLEKFNFFSKEVILLCAVIFVFTLWRRKAVQYYHDLQQSIRS